MTQPNDADLGPIDYMVVEFPPGASDFDGEMARELKSLVDAELIRVLDVLILDKDDCGAVDALELEDLGETSSLRSLAGQLAEVLAADDVADLAEAIEPGCRAGVVIWENTWAAPFAIAARESGGQLVASGRISTQAIIASLQMAELQEGA